MSAIETRCFIAGEYVEGTGQPFTLLNPSTEEKVADLKSASKADVDRAVSAAAAAQPAWADQASNIRAACLMKLADLFEKNAGKLNELEGLSMGQLARDGPMHAAICADKLRFSAGLANSVTGDSSLLSPGQLGIVVRQPYGVVAGICPWNVPLIMLVMKVGPAVAAGNAIIIKTSEKSPLASAFVGELTKEAGFPAGIIQILVGMGETGKLLAEHHGIAKISFTGSTRTGRLVAAGAAMSNLKNVSLELGGKSPTILFNDADLAKAVPACTFSIMWNSGQICIANSRVYVQEGIAEEFKKQYAAALSTFKPGNSSDPNTNLGPVADAIQFKAVSNFLAEGNKTAKPLIGGKTSAATGGAGYFVEPTIYDNLAADHLLNKNEIFGPVVVVHTFKDEAEAIRLANDSEYGLYASVWTQDIDRAIRVAKALEAGNIGVNATSPTGSNALPFGGYKSSGWGREGGIEDVLRWTEQKSITVSIAPFTS